MPVNQITADGVATSGRDFYEVGAVLHNEIVTGAMRSSAGVLKDPLVLNWKETGRTIPVDRKPSEYPPEPLPKFGLVLDPLSPLLP